VFESGERERIMGVSGEALRS